MDGARYPHEALTLGGLAFVLYNIMNRNESMPPRFLLKRRAHANALTLKSLLTVPSSPLPNPLNI